MGNMQCVHPEGDMKYPPNMFKVKNVDDDGDTVSKGFLEVGKTELILHQQGKDRVYWPLRSLRRYGFDSDLFSFESGRRCPTGEGIFAFKCKKAQSLFNELQINIQRCGDNPNSHQPAQFMSIPSHQQFMGNTQATSHHMNGFDAIIPRTPPSQTVTYINAGAFTLTDSTVELQAAQGSARDPFRGPLTSGADGGSYAALKENNGNDNSESAMLNYAHLRLSEDEEGATASGHDMESHFNAEFKGRGSLYNNVCSCDVTDSGVICQKSETASRCSNDSITDDLEINTKDENGNRSKLKIKKISPKPKIRKLSDVVNGNVHLNGNPHMVPTPWSLTPVVASPVPGVYVNLDTIGELPNCRSAFAFADLPTPRSAASRGSNGSEFVFDALHTSSSRSPGGPNYANLDGLEQSKKSSIVPDSLVLQAPPKKKINYIELDLDSLEATRNDRANARSSSTSSSPKTPQTPTLDPRGPYAMIDIDRTIALSNTQRPVEDDSTRRTRHDWHDRAVLPKLT